MVVNVFTAKFYWLVGMNNSVQLRVYPSSYSYSWSHFYFFKYRVFFLWLDWTMSGSELYPDCTHRQLFSLNEYVYSRITTQINEHVTVRRQRHSHLDKAQKSINVRRPVKKKKKNTLYFRDVSYLKLIKWVQ